MDTFARFAQPWLLRDRFELEPRGTIPAKGKGDIETWYLVGSQQAMPAAAGASVPA